MKPNLERRLEALESKASPKASVDWQARLERYRKWFEDGEKWQGPQTEEEKADFARYKQYFYELNVGVAAPR